MSIAAALVTAGISVPAFMKFKDISEEDRKKHGRGWWSAAVFAVTAAVTAFISEREGTDVMSMVNMTVLLNFLFLLAYVDKNHRLIPNAYIAGVFALRTVIIIVKALVGYSPMVLLLNSLAGFAAGAVLTGAAYVISGRGIGSGDVKMFAAVGYFAGGIAAVDILIYSTVLCALCGILLLALRKCSAKDRIPMAPFAFAGALVYVVTGM